MEKPRNAELQIEGKQFSVARDGRREGWVPVRVVWGICSGLMTSSRIFYVNKFYTRTQAAFLPSLFSLYSSKLSAEGN